MRRNDPKRDAVTKNMTVDVGVLLDERGDRIGRRMALLGSVLWFGVLTVLMEGAPGVAAVSRPRSFTVARTGRAPAASRPRAHGTDHPVLIAPTTPS
jgi:hypothetical protein